MKWNELKVQQLLMPWAMARGHIALPNVYFFKWESDMVSVSTVGKIIEYEIKVSIQDFRAEKRKRKKIDLLATAFLRRAKDKNRPVPNYFNYVCPHGVIPEADVPDYAGLIYVTRKGAVIEVKRPPQLHNELINGKQTRSLLKAMMWKLWLKLYAPPGWKPPSKVRRKRRKRARRNARTKKS